MTIVTVTWTDVCSVSRTTPDRGFAVLVDECPVAVFVLTGGDVYAVDHVDPFSGAPVMARGLVGSAGSTPTVASPLHKQRFELTTGRCIDDPAVSIDVWPARIVGGQVQIGSFRASSRRNRLETA